MAALAFALGLVACAPDRAAPSVPEVTIPEPATGSSAHAVAAAPSAFDWSKVDGNHAVAEGFVRAGASLLVLAHPHRMIGNGTRIARPLERAGCDGFGAVVEALGGAVAVCHHDGAARLLRLDRPGALPLELPPAVAAQRVGSRARPRPLVLAGDTTNLAVYDGTSVHRGDGASWRSAGVGPLPESVMRARVEPRRALLAAGHLALVYALPSGIVVPSIDLESGAVTDLGRLVAPAAIESFGVSPDGEPWCVVAGPSPGVSRFVSVGGHAVRPIAGLPEVPGPVVAFAFAPAGEVIVLSEARGVLRVRGTTVTELMPGWPARLRGEAVEVVGASVWVATREAGLLRVELESGRTEHVPLPILP